MDGICQCQEPRRTSWNDAYTWINDIRSAQCGRNENMLCTYGYVSRWQWYAGLRRSIWNGVWMESHCHSYTGAGASMIKCKHYSIYVALNLMFSPVRFCKSLTSQKVSLQPSHPLDFIRFPFPEYWIMIENWRLLSFHHLICGDPNKGKRNTQITNLHSNEE